MKIFKRVRATLNKTFITSCPVCFRQFYGFDDYEQHVRIKGKNYRIICHMCALDLKPNGESLIDYRKG